YFGIGRLLNNSHIPEVSIKSISKDKTKILFLENSNWMCDLEKYLGVRIYHGRVSIVIYYDIVKKDSSKMIACKAKTLAFAGRTTLIKIASKKINCDRSFSFASRLVIAARILRDHHGCFIYAFACKLRHCSIVKVELELFFMILNWQITEDLLI
ncbi:hypothetical protein CR513_46933, partial [Mucuna pruriens]